MRVPLPRTLHMRIMLAIALLQLVVVALFSFYMLVEMVGKEITDRQVFGHKLLSQAAPTVEHHLLDSKDKAELKSYLSRLVTDQTVTRILVKNSRGEVLFEQERPSEPPHPLARWLKGAGQSPQVAMPLRTDGRDLGMMIINLSNDTLNQNTQALLENVLYLFLILLAIDLITSELLIKYFIAPLGPLTMMALDVSHGNLDSVMHTSERDSEEVRQLANAFVESAKIMRRQIAELEQARAQLAQNELRLRNLVNNMQEVLLEIDKDGYVKFLNPAWETLTGYAVEASLNKLFSAFLVQPQQQVVFTSGLLEKITLYDLRVEVRAQNGDSVWMQMNTTLQYNEAGEFTGLVSTLIDISENLRLQQLQRVHEQDLYKLTITDPLTGVFNRRHFDEVLANLLQLNLNKERQLALIVIDIDGFKFINDTYGHPVGDDVLRSLANALTSGKYHAGVVARLAGDEFAVLLQNTGEEDAERIAHEIHSGIGNIVITLSVGQLHVQTSIGVAVAPSHGKTPQDIVRAADVALYHAKKSGRNRVDSLSKDVGEAIMDIFSQGFELRNAFADGMILPFMQPIVDLNTGEVFAYEVLTRLKRGDEYVVADQFVIIAEDLGLIRDMDLFIIKQSLEQTPQHIHLFLNVSLSSFYAPEFSKQLREILIPHAAKGRPITIEFTERQTTTMTPEFLRYFAELRAAGCRIALDDFGVGYSTYAYLRQLRPEFVKIDGSFVQQIMHSQEDASIVQQIRELSEIFGANTIAEHVEDEATFQRLKQFGVRYGQGYYFGRPMAISHYAWQR